MTINLLGHLERIRAKVFEVGDMRNSSGHQRGVVSDLLPHILSTLYDLGLAGQKAEDLRVKLGMHEPWMSPGTYRMPAAPSENETYARAIGRFAESFRYGPIFYFEVGKYWSKNEGFLELDFEHGHATISYEKPFEFAAESRFFKLSPIVTVDDCAPLSPSEFKELIDGNADRNFDKAAMIAEFIGLVRKAGFEQGRMVLVN